MKSNDVMIALKCF